MSGNMCHFWSWSLNEIFRVADNQRKEMMNVTWLIRCAREALASFPKCLREAWKSILMTDEISSRVDSGNFRLKILDEICQQHRRYSCKWTQNKLIATAYSRQLDMQNLKFQISKLKTDTKTFTSSFVSFCIDTKTLIIEHHIQLELIFRTNVRVTSTWGRKVSAEMG